MEAPLGAGLFHKTQKIAADDLHRFQHIAAPAFQPEAVEKSASCPGRSQVVNRTV